MVINWRLRQRVLWLINIGRVKTEILLIRIKVQSVNTINNTKLIKYVDLTK